MSDFERISYYYAKGWAKVSQLRQYVVYGTISAAQYQEITGQPYEGSA